MIRIGIEMGFDTGVVGPGRGASARRTVIEAAGPAHRAATETA